MQYILSLGMGVIVGVIYGLSHIKSPAPPIIALLGLLGMVIGEAGVSMVAQRLENRSQTATHSEQPAGQIMPSAQTAAHPAPPRAVPEKTSSE